MAETAKTETMDMVISPKENQVVHEKLGKYLTGRTSISDRFLARYAASQILFDQGHYRECFQLLEKLVMDSESSDMLRRDMSYRMAECQFHLGNYQQADKLFDTVRLFETVVKTNPGTLEGEVIYGQAVSSLANNRMEEALNRLDNLVTQYPYYAKDARLYYPLGLLSLKKGNDKKALEYFGKDLEEPKNLYFAGLAARQLQDSLAAITHFENLAKKFAGTVWEERGRFEVAETYYWQADDKLAEEAFSAWLTRYEKSRLKPAVQYRLACIDYRQGRSKEAWTKLQAMPKLKHWPALKEQARQLKLMALVAQGRWNELARLTHQRRKPKDLPPDQNYEQLWALVAQEKDQKAKRLAKECVEAYVDPDYTPLILLLDGFRQAGEGQKASALASFQTVLDRFPNTEAQALAMRLVALTYLQSGRYQELLSHLKVAWDNLSPTFKKIVPEVEFYLAEAWLEIGSYKEAAQAYSHFLQEVPNHTQAPYAHLGLAVALSQSDRMNLAFQTLQEFNQLAERTSNKGWSALALLETSNIFFNQRNYEQAVLNYRAFKTQFPSHPNAPRAQYQEGLSLYRLGYYADAMDVWTALAKNHPREPLAEDGLFQAARTAFDLGRSTEAVHLYQVFVKEYPKSPKVLEARLQMANGLYNAGRFAEAAAAFKTFLRYYPTAPEAAAAQGFLQMCYVKSGMSLEQIDKMSQGQPKSPVLADLYWEKGAAAFNAKDYAAAEPLFQKILLEFPGSPLCAQAGFYRGQSLFLLEKHEEAATAYKVFLNQYPQDEQAPLARFNMGISYFTTNHFQDSAKTFEEFVKTHPSHELAVSAAQNIPLCYARLGEISQAEKAYEVLLSKTKDPQILASPLLQIGLLFEQTGQDARAADYYSQIIPGTPEEPEALYYLASVYARLGALEKAEKTSEKLSKVTPAGNPFRILGIMRLAEFYTASNQWAKSKVLYEDAAANSADQGIVMQAQQKLAELSQTQTQ